MKNNFPFVFGTSGIRAIMGEKTGQLNNEAYKQIACGLNIILKNKKILIAFDTRTNSKRYAEIMAEILACKNDVLLFNKPTPTPVLTYSVSKNDFDFGIVITASHNNKEYNGIKFYNEQGILIDDTFAEKLNLAIQDATYLGEKAKYKIADCCLEKQYINFVKNININEVEPIKIIYSPLNGTAGHYVKKVLCEKANIRMPISQKFFSSKFTTCPNPNPEFESAFEKCLQIAKKEPLIIATDPDGDRLGALVYNKEYQFLSGNEIAILFLNYLLCYSNTENSFVVGTIVSTPLAKKMSEIAGVRYFETLTGFKHISNRIMQTKGNLLFAFEESNGFIINKNVVDKDGISALKLFVEMTSFYQKQNKNLIEVLNEIYEKYGYYFSISKSVEKEQYSNFAQKLSGLRIKGLSVEDFSLRQDELKSNMLCVSYMKTCAYVRQSGTEPKLKIYIHANASSKIQAENNAQQLLEIIKKIL